MYRMQKFGICMMKIGNFWGKTMSEENNCRLGAIREAKEEVGVDLNPGNGRVLFTKTRKIIEGKRYL